MGLVAAKCTQCGANIEVDDSKEAGICPHCNTAFIVEKAINLYNNVTNIANQVNYYYGESEFEKEKKQCKVLLMLLNNLDLEYLKERALKVMDTNPENSLAQMIYDCDFCISYNEDLPFLEFREEPLRKYLDKECGNIDAETCATFIHALVLKMETQDNVSKLVDVILKNISLLELSSDVLYQTYDVMAQYIGDIHSIKNVLYSAKLSKTSAIVNIISQQSNGTSEFTEASNLKFIANAMLYSRKKIATAFAAQVKNSKLSQEEKNKILGKISCLLTQSSNASAPTAPTKKSKGGWGFLTFIGGVILFWGLSLPSVGLSLFGGALTVWGLIMLCK